MITKKVAHRRFTQKRINNGRTEMYDSNTGVWIPYHDALMISSDLSSAPEIPEPLLGDGGTFGGGGASGSWDSGSSSDSGGGSCGGD